MRRLVLLVLLALPAVASPPAEQAPSSVVFARDELGRTFVQCRYLDAHGSFSVTATDDIACDFTETVLRIPNAAEDREKAERAEREWEAWWKTVVAEKDPLHEARTACAFVRQILEARQQHLATNKYAAALLPALQRDQALTERLCACSSVACYHDLAIDTLRAAAREATETCSISRNAAWKDQFQRVGTSWMRIEYSSDPCYSSSTRTLSREPGANSNAWTLRILNVPLRGGDPAVCDGAVTEKIYGPHPFGAVAANCRWIELN